MDAAAAASPKGGPSFWTRHRATILTIALILYTVALGVGVADDVFHLGLFPTELERTARSAIAALDSPDERTRQAAADKLVREIDTFVAVPELFRALGSGSLPRRTLAAECIRQITKADQGYDPKASPAERRAAVQRWRRWWDENKLRY